MYAPKATRRRTQDFESNRMSQPKRKLKRELEKDTIDSVEIISESQIPLQYKTAAHRFHGSSGEAGLKCLHSNRVCVDLANGTDAQNHCFAVDQPKNGRTRERINNGAALNRCDCSPPNPPLPSSSLRESERMLFVQRWINSISPNLPLWVQISVNKVVPISSPYCYPTEEDPDFYDGFLSELDTPTPVDTNHNRCGNLRLCKPNSQTVVNTGQLTVTTPFPFEQSASQSAVTNSHDFINIQQAVTSTSPVTTNSTTAITTLSILGPRFPSTMPSTVVGRDLNSVSCTNTQNNLLGQMQTYQTDLAHLHSHHHHHHQQQSNFATIPDGQLNNNNLTDKSVNIGNCDTNQHYKLNEDCNNAIGRLFDDVETQLIVKLFCDYFTNGSCPMLKEVRHRIVNTVLDNRRTAAGIRAKIKRLQKSGRWTDYTCI